MQPWIKCSVSAKFSPVPTFAPFRPYCIFLPLFCRFRGLGQCRNVCGTDFDLEGVEILAKIMQNGRKKQMFGTRAKLSTGATFSPELNLSRLLHLARCQLNVMNVPQ